jgi:hypothetical protein
MLMKTDAAALTLRSITKDRDEWTARVKIVGDRAVGSLHRGDRVVRPAFNVRVDHMNVFKVDIGTGSGVKVAFHTGT